MPYSHQIVLDFAPDLMTGTRGLGKKCRDQSTVFIDLRDPGWPYHNYPVLATLDENSRLYISGHCHPGADHLSASERSDAGKAHWRDIAILIARSMTSPAVRDRDCKDRLKISLLSCD